jgi:hypothetical protein
MEVTSQFWPVTKSFVPGPQTDLPGGTIVCMLERDDATRSPFARFAVAWLTGEKEPLRHVK